MDTSHGFSSGLTRQKIALLIDFDNVILGIDDPGFDVEIVVNALRTRGLIVMGRAYGDWYRHNRHRRRLMEQGIDLIETPVFGPIIKNSADMHMALDAFEIAHTFPHIDTFCIVSGDSDFLPLIKRLQSRDKMVIVIAGHKFTSELVRRNCNEYLAYENLLAESVGATEDVTSLEGAYQLLERTIATLLERDIEVRSSTVKQFMVQLNPAFSERNFGCAQFKQFLDRAARAGVVKLGQRDGLSGEFLVVPLNETIVSTAPTPRATPETVAPANGNAGAPTEEKEAPRPRRGRRGRGDKFTPDATENAPVEGVANETVAVDNAASETIAENAPVEAFRDPHSILGRVPLRRGRLRFSAREGRTTLNTLPGDENAKTEDVAPSGEEIVAVVEEITEIVAQETAPEPETSEDAAPVAPSEPTVLESADAAEMAAAIEAASEKPTRKRTTRGGRKRKPKTEETPTEETPAEDAPQVLAEGETDPSQGQHQVVAPVESEAVILEHPTDADAPTNDAPVEIAATAPTETATTEATTTEAATTESAASEGEATETKAKPRRAPRRRPAAKKAKVDAAESTLEAS